VIALLEIIVFLAGLLLDRAAKILTMIYLQPTGVGTSVEVIPGILSFTYVENRGAAHGILQGQVWFFIPVTIIVCGFLLFFLIKNRKKAGLTMRWGLALVLAGAIGNLFDRITYGYVIDMIEVTFIEYPVFNLADNMVVIGTALFALYILFFDKSIFVSKKKETVADAANASEEEIPVEAFTVQEKDTEIISPDIQHKNDE